MVEESNQFESAAKKPKSPTVCEVENAKSEDTQQTFSRCLPSTLRFILSLNWITLSVLWVFLLLSLSICYVFDTYVDPIIEASGMWLGLEADYDEDASFAFEAWTDYTYYERHCEKEDITGDSPGDITWEGKNKGLYKDFTDMVMFHGAGIIPDLLDPKLANETREVILKMNALEPLEKQFDLKETKNRWALRVNPYDTKLDRNKRVQRSLQDIASNSVLQKTLEDLLGPDPAIVEVAAITSAPGAPEQDWHSDTWTDSSALLSGRTYTSLYSLFIYFQDTYADMGATALCPGTHMCTTVADVESCFYGEVATGSGMLLNSQTFHQGSGNDAFHRPDGTRVMMIISFASKPEHKTDGRRLPLGSVYGIPWYIWGHNLRELLIFDQLRWNPLHALGITKSGKNWGWTYLMGSIAAFSENFRNGVLDPEWFLRRDVWTSYAKTVSIVNVAANFVASLGAVLMYIKFIKKSNILQGNFYQGLRRCLTFNASCLVVASLSLYLFSKTEFARGVTSGTRFRKVPFKSYPPDLSEEYYESVRTLDRTDIMFGERLDAYYTFQNTYFYDYHPGNIAYRQSLEEAALEYVNVPLELQDAFMETRILDHLTIPITCEDDPDWYIIGRWSGKELGCDHVAGNPMLRCRWEDDEGVLASDACPVACDTPCGDSTSEETDVEFRRFVRQNDYGDWLEMDFEDIRETTRKGLLSTSNPVLKVLTKELDFMLSQCKYGDGGRGYGAFAGVHTAMSRIHAPRLVNSLKELLYNEDKVNSLRPVESSSLLSNKMIMEDGHLEDGCNLRSIVDGEVMRGHFANSVCICNRASRSYMQNDTQWSDNKFTYAKADWDY